MFVRPRKGGAYRACGRVLLEFAEGDRPMSIVWKLETPLPVYGCSASSACCAPRSSSLQWSWREHISAPATDLAPASASHLSDTTGGSPRLNNPFH
jgi:hypothetical protein